ncbi:LysR family transcriptional regulator [Yersinia entomophaga]|uniref:LysR family transcriptional regulator n=1 Tax=Yersinia entomophaga TaxID=935293 RepID=UPI000B766805|nr:LysR family transcriptional regulator [Yersinia entomophaga]OWF89819.1 LysR family transcriptional regulator [Yersinia entomophaga]
MNNLRAIDLNLLVILDVLLIERHVSRAATRLHMSQPAVSHALNRLRYLLDDPLLVRAPGGFQLTRRSLELVEPLQQVLEQVRQLVGSAQFVPAQASQSFRMALSDYGAAIVLPGLLQRLRQQAPGIDLVVVQLSREQMVEQVLAGQLDLALGVFPHLPAGLSSCRLFEEHFVCVADANHPLGNEKRLTLDDYLAQPHLLVSMRGESAGEVEAALTELGLRRRIAAIMPHFLVAPQAVVGTDLLLTIASRVVATQPESMRLQRLELPFVVPSFDFVQIWHPRNSHKEDQRWLRQQVVESL